MKHPWLMGLGSLHIFLHSSALFVELFVSARILKSLGTFAGFVVHVVVTILECSVSSFWIWLCVGSVGSE